MKALLAATLTLFPLPALQAQPDNNQQPPEPPPAKLKVIVSPAPPAVPAATITLGERHGHATPCRRGCNHTGAGIIDVAQPGPDTLVVTMMGVAVATPHPCKASVASFDFDLTQCFEVAVDKPEGKRIKMTLEARVIGLLRSHKCGKGTAEESGACATVGCGEAELVSVCAPPHAVACGENLSINDHDGPACVPIAPGKFTLHQTFHVSAAHPRTALPCKAPSAEFAPDPALDPLWISYWEPFHGAQKKDFGFQVTLKVLVEDASAEAKNDKKAQDNNAGEADTKADKPDKLPALSKPAQ
jgi:hypothetical protein